MADKVIYSLLKRAYDILSDGQSKTKSLQRQADRDAADYFVR